MKRFVAALALTLLGLTAGCLDEGGSGQAGSGPLLRYHFAGRTHLPSGTNAARFKEVDSLPATAELRAQLAQKLADAALPFWVKDLPAGATSQSALLRPLFDDLLVAAGYVEARGPFGRTDTVLAIELSDARAQVWDGKLRELMTAWKLGTPRDLALEGYKGWEVKRSQAPNTFQFFRADKWVVLGLGQDRVTQLPPLLQASKRTGRPLPASTNAFLELALDLPNLRTVFPILNRFPLPAMAGTMSARGADVRTEVRFRYGKRNPFVLEPWKVPTNLVSEPLISFTAVQGLAPVLGRLQGFSSLGLKQPPNQLYVWGGQHEQCRVFFATPVPDPTNAMKEVSVGLPRYMNNTFSNLVGSFMYRPDRAEVTWAGLPFLIPVVHPEQSGGTEYLVGGILPPPINRRPVNDQLFAQIRGRTNLLYYDWEFTKERIVHAKQMYQLAGIMTARPTPKTNSASKRWLVAIGPKLDDAITEITQTAPGELLLTRRSSIGLTGFEISTFSTWLDSPRFPFNFEMPPSVPLKVSTNNTAPNPKPYGASTNRATTGPRPPGRTTTAPPSGAIRPNTNAAPPAKR